MKYKGLIRRLVDFLEDHLYSDDIFEQIRHEFDLSEYHLHHMFKSITGHSIQDYLLKRRISDQMYRFAASNGRYPLPKVVSECGFSNHRAFHKFISREFKTHPKKYYKSFEGYELFPSFNVFKFFCNPSRSDMCIDTSIVSIGSLKIYGDYHSSEIDFVVSEGPSKYRVVSDSRIDGNLKYTNFKGDLDMDENKTLLEIPKQSYIKFKGYSDEWFYEQAYRYIYNTYILNTKYKIKNEGIDLLQINDFDNTYGNYHLVEFYIPIEKDQSND